jgi:hypothetical protein
MDSVEARRVLNCLPDRARSRFWDFASWQRIWDPIASTQVLYDDGVHQEIAMAVERDGGIERVRTVRYLLGGDIVFFSPDPPPTMNVHRGAWRFWPHGGRCLAVAQREYRLTRRPDEDERAFAARRRRYSERFEERLDAILSCFVDHFSQRGQHEP